MALNSSGAISIGGATTGQSINIELGRAATTSSNMGESALRTLAGVASGAISLSNFYGKSNATVFTPAGGTSSPGTAVTGSSIGNNTATASISASTSVVWNWTKTGLGTSNIATGGSGSTITFSLASSGTSVSRTSDFNVNSTADGVTRYWQVTLTAAAFV